MCVCVKVCLCVYLLAFSDVRYWETRQKCIYVNEPDDLIRLKAKNWRSRTVISTKHVREREWNNTLIPYYTEDKTLAIEANKRRTKRNVKERERGREIVSAMVVRATELSK